MCEDKALLEEEVQQNESHRQELTSDPEVENAVCGTDEADVLPDEDQTESSVPETTILPYRDRYYLRYREGKRTAQMDLDGTKSFLQSIGFDGGELRKAREQKEQSQNFRNADKAKKTQVYCSYCGTEIAGVEFYRSSGGRIRCTNCSSTVVNTQEEMESICQIVISNMSNFFGAHLNIPISIEIINERKIKKKAGIPLGTIDSQSTLVLGVAVNKKNKYNILLENGAPRISLIATFAHELTHIWQYVNWDNKQQFKKCSPIHRQLIYEGMAKWAEIQYLYLIGETNVARREEIITRNREDAYGLGFCLYEERYPLIREAMSCQETPFTPDRYPLV